MSQSTLVFRLTGLQLSNILQRRRDEKMRRNGAAERIIAFAKHIQDSGTADMPAGAAVMMDGVVEQLSGGWKHTIADIGDLCAGLDHEKTYDVTIEDLTWMGIFWDSQS